MSLREKVETLQRMASGPDIMQAVDQFYHPDVVILEGDGSEHRGAENQKARIAEWGTSVEEVHDAGVKAIAVHETSPGNGTAFVETYMDITFKGAGRMPFDEVAVQQWKDGRIVHERFYYNMPSGGGEG